MPPETPSSIARGESGRSVQTTWAYTLGSVVFFYVVFDAVVVVAVANAFRTAPSLIDGTLLVLTIVAAALHIRYCWFLRAGLGGGVPGRWTIALIAPAALAWIVGLFSSTSVIASVLPLWMSLSLVACLLPMLHRWLLIGGAALVSLVHDPLSAAVLGRPLEVGLENADRLWFIGIYAGLLPVMVMSSIWWWGIVVTLDRNRRASADLAVARERLRFAADLHDIQGHHLQVIALKTELAERLLSIDPEAAREHVHEARLIAKEALEETRSLVAGYRETSFDDELENAREVLTAAGAACDVRVDTTIDDPETQRVLALVVREATTNILRHSTAETVGIRLTRVDDGTSIFVTNDGVSASARPSRAPGTGLAGLRDRLAALGGVLDTDEDADGGRFELSAWVPVRVNA